MSDTSVSVAEQAESIDNPMHEAAKRGATSFCTSETFLIYHVTCNLPHSTVLMCICVYLNRQSELAEGMSGEQGGNQRVG